MTPQSFSTKVECIGAEEEVEEVSLSMDDNTCSLPCTKEERPKRTEGAIGRREEEEEDVALRLERLDILCNSCSLKRFFFLCASTKAAVKDERRGDIKF